MMRRNKELFKDWPKTKIDYKNVTITVNPTYINPKFVAIRKSLIFLTCAGSVVLFTAKTHLFYKGVPDDERAQLIIALVILCAFWIVLIRTVFKTNSVIKISPESISVKNGWLGRTSEYKRAVAHGFNMELHEKAGKEQDEAAFTRMKDRIYRDSFHVFMDHMEGRIYIADIYKKRKAEALLARLHGADQFIDILRQDVSKGAPPEDDLKPPGGF